MAAASASHIIQAAALLRGTGGSARGFTGVAGHPNDHLVAIVGPKCEADMVTEGASTTRATWSQMVTNVSGKMGQDKMINGYFGSVFGTAVYRTTNLLFASLTGNTDATQNWVFGRSTLIAYSLQQMEPQIYINNPSSGDVGNPYRNRYTIAWHAYYASGAPPDSSSRLVRWYSLGR
jgi:hypothetical protein